MRRVLLVVSLTALVAIGSTVWLYTKVRPELSETKKKLDQLNEHLSAVRTVLSNFCLELATQENLPGFDANVVGTLDQCMNIIPDDATLPALKAEVLVPKYIRNPKPSNMVYLDRALQAADVSLNISKAANVKPTVEAMDWKGIAYCLKASVGQSSEREAFVKSATETFQAEPERLRTLGDMSAFKINCPVEVKKALHIQ